VPGVEHWDGTTYSRSVRTSSGPAVVSLSAVDGGVRLVASGDLATQDVQRLEHLLALGADSSAAESHLTGDALLDVGRRPGLRCPGSVHHGETLVRTVVGQQVSLAGARTVLGRIAAEHGEPLPHKACGVTRLFPTMAALGSADPLGLPLPRSRARAVVAGAAAVVAASTVPDDPHAMPARPELLALPGVGPWTADYVDLRCRLDPDVFLVSDLAVRRVLEAAGVDGSPRGAAVRSAGWSPYRSTALIHLWTGYLEPRGPGGRSAAGAL
jgi:AraC family transcriptional regulator of adaptative response / DNA-3-methyladenine glycosylase II